MADKVIPNPTGYGTIKDVMALFDGYGERVETIVNMLTETNEILKDVIFVPCNQGTSHITTTKTGIPSAAWRRLYQGVEPTKSTHAQVTETCGMLTGLNVLDYDLWLLNGKSADYRLEESRDAMESINQDFARALFYGDVGTQPEAFTGLAPRLSECNGTNKLRSSFNVVSPIAPNDSVLAGGDLTSIYVVGWSPRTVHGLYPKGNTPTITHTPSGDDGKHYETDSEGRRYPAVLDRYDMKTGLAVRDWRYTARLCNLSLSLLSGANPTIDIFDALTTIYHRIRKYQKMAKFAMYLPTELFEILDKVAQKKIIYQLNHSNIDGQEILNYRGIPLRECEAIRTNEEIVPLAVA